MTLGNAGNQQGTQVSIGIVFVLFGRRIVVGGKPMGLGPVFFTFIASRGIKLPFSISTRPTEVSVCAQKAKTDNTKRYWRGTPHITLQLALFSVRTIGIVPFTRRVARPYRYHIYIHVCVMCSATAYIIDPLTRK